ncbi:MAG TPA: NnrU family protein, partial [Nannocystaceae bacterium]|nr:NnrU family protein [Nannocystaceae bacterium]
MPDALLRLLLAAAAFVLLHVGVAGSPLRAVLVRRLGKGYLGLFSLLSALSLAAMIGAYHAAAAPSVNFDLWVTPRWALWLPFVG